MSGTTPLGFTLAQPMLASFVVSVRTPDARVMGDSVTVCSTATLAPPPAPLMLPAPAPVPLLAAPLVGLAAASAPLPAPAAPLQILGGLQARGFHLLYKRRFWIPFLRPHRVEVAPDRFLGLLDQKSGRLEIASRDFAPVAVRDARDVTALSAFYLGTAGAPPLAGALNALYLNGYRFERRDRAVGPYGAWRAIQDGARFTPPTAFKYSAPPVVLRHDQDAYRMQFFRLGQANPALEHRDAAETLQALQQRGAVLWCGEEQHGAETVHARLSGSRPPGGIRVGTKETPLVDLSAASLTDQAASLRAYDAALAEYGQLLACGIPAGEGRSAWHAVRPPVDGETFPERLQWLRTLMIAEWSDPTAGVAAFEFLRDAQRPGDAQGGAVKDYAAIRQVLGQSGQPVAQRCFLRLRDKFERAAPGAEPADVRRALFLQMLKALGDGQVVEKCWKALDGAAPRAERVGVFLDLLGQDHNYVDSARRDYKAIQSLVQPGETLQQAAGEFKRVRGLLGAHTPGEEACEAFKFLRRGLEASLPGAWTPQQRTEMFTRLMHTVGSFTVAHETWQALSGEGTFTKPHPPADFAQRLDALLALYKQEGDHMAVARADFDVVQREKAANETITDTVNDFCALRGKLGANAEESARQAFAFLRGDINASLDGPWTVDEKRQMYMQLLTGLDNHERALKCWGRLQSIGGPITEFPQRLDAFLQLSTLEHHSLDEGMHALGAVLKGRRPGEAVGATVQAYAAMRPCLGTYDSEGARAAFAFMRGGELTESLPGPWTDSSRESLYVKILQATGTQQTACAEWDYVVGDRGRSVPLPGRFEARVDALVALLKLENGATEAANSALGAIDAVQTRTGQPVADLLAEYQTLRSYVGQYASSDGRRLFRFVHDSLDPALKSLYLDLQQAADSFGAAQDAWHDLTADPKDLAARVAVLTDCLRKEQGHMDVARLQLDAVLAHRRVGESIARAGQALDRVRQAVPQWDGVSVSQSFAFMRENAEDSQESIFLQVLKASPGLDFASGVWTVLKDAGPPGSFNARVNTLLGQPVEQWPAMLETIQHLVRSVPRGVDPDRGSRALFHLVTVPDEGALSEVLTRLDATPGLDRTTALEWLCAMMAEAGSVAAFEQGWRDVHRPGAPGTVAERQLFMAGLVESTRRSPQGFTAATDILRRVDRVPAAEWFDTATQAAALTTAMQGRAMDASRAFIYILDAREAGRFASETLADTLGRFATLYATNNGSLELALGKLEQGTKSGGGGIQDGGDGDVIIGGIRVPRGKKTPNGPPPLGSGWIRRAWEELRKKFEAE